METVARGEELDRAQVRAAALGLLDPAQGEEPRKRFLQTLAQRGETPGELAGFVEEFLGVARDPGVDEAEFRGPLLDVVGTGGDRLDLFNVSTSALFVAVGAGAVGVKHGNRAISSKAGGADVLESLGVRLELEPERFPSCLREAGCGFLFAPLYHPGFAAVGPLRRELAAQGQRTMFNLLGPLLNPARVQQMLVGVARPELLRPYAEIFRRLGRRRVLVVCGQAPDGRWMDEGSVVGPTRCALLENGKITEFILEGGEYGCRAGSLDELRGGDAAENATILRGLLAGRIRGGRREMLLFNAALALKVAGLAATVTEGVEQACESVDSGRAAAALERFLGWHRQRGGEGGG